MTLSLVVGKAIQQAKKVPMKASGSGDKNEVRKMREKVYYWKMEERKGLGLVSRKIPWNVSLCSFRREGGFY